MPGGLDHRRVHCTLKDWRAGLDSLSLSLLLHRREEHESNPNLSRYGFQMERFAEIFASTYCTHTSWRVTGPMQHLEKPNLLTDLTEPLQCLAELRRASVRLQMRKCEDDVGLTAEVWTCSFQQNSGNICCFVYQGMFHHSTAPRSLCRTIFNMLPKQLRPIQGTDFRAMVNIHLFCTVSARRVLERESNVTLITTSRKSNTVFVVGIEEHRLTANIFVDETLAVGIAVCRV